jgi:hypothetical protein
VHHLVDAAHLAISIGTFVPITLDHPLSIFADFLGFLMDRETRRYETGRGQLVIAL